MMRPLICIGLLACGGSGPVQSPLPEQEGAQQEGAEAPVPENAPVEGPPEAPAPVAETPPMDPAWAQVPIQSFGEPAPRSRFFVARDGRVLRIDPEAGGWWDPDTHTLTAVAGLRGADPRLAAATDDLALYAHVAIDDERALVEVFDTTTGNVQRHDVARAASERAPTHIAAAAEVLATIDEGGTVRFYGRAGELRTVRSGVRHPAALALSRDGSAFAAWSASEGREVVQVTRGTNTRRVAPPTSPGTDYYALAFSSDGRRLAMGTFNAVRVVDLRSGRVILDRTFEDAPVSAVAIAPDGRRVFAASVSMREAAILGRRETTPLPFISGTVLGARWTEHGIVGVGPGTLLRWRNDAEDHRVLRAVPSGVWRPGVAPRIEVHAYTARVDFNATTGRVVDGGPATPFEAVRFQREMRGVEAPPAEFEAAAGEGVYLLDRSADGSRRIVMPPRRRAKLVGSSSLERIVQVNDAGGERFFSADGTWFITTSSYREGSQTLFVRSSDDGRTLAEAQVVEGYGTNGRKRIQGFTVTPDDTIVIRSDEGVHTYRYADDALTQIAHADGKLDSWFVAGNEMLGAIDGDDGDDGDRILRWTLPDLRRVGEVHLPGVSDPVLNYIPDGRHFGALAGGRMHIVPLPNRIPNRTPEEIRR